MLNRDYRLMLPRPLSQPLRLTLLRPLQVILHSVLILADPLLLAHSLINPPPLQVILHSILILADPLLLAHSLINPRKAMRQLLSGRMNLLSVENDDHRPRRAARAIAFEWKLLYVVAPNGHVAMAIEQGIFGPRRGPSPRRPERALSQLF